MVLVDTSVWSSFLRRKIKSSNVPVETLRHLIANNQVCLTGIVRQEILSGIREQAQYNKIADILNGFPDLLATSEDHTLASLFYNTCRSKGIQGSHIDYLICAQAVNGTMAILTEDTDFKEYAKYLPIDLMENA